ncbi:Uncharacterised protein [Escherichia coli]|nr:hypothetical protein [Escherichia coli]CAD5789332.1 Uncharacterised protein [Escherichia coli]CAD5791021.1 Uncharacterised protein [Escherichia coli]CAD5792440.1 Uncharacterised protein [Escherichia coli]
MALTVTAAFNEFQRNIVNLDSSQTDRARVSRDWLLGKMNTFSNNDVYFPIIYPDIHTGFGSFARHTKIRPLDDIDLMFGLDGDDCVYSETDVKRNQEAATLKLKSYDWNFDIVPAFITTPDSFGKTYYLIPDGNCHWKKTDPRIDMQKVTDLNVKLSGNIAS